MEILLGIIGGFFLLAVFLNWGIWLLWGVGVYLSYSGLMAGIILAIMSTSWFQPYPFPRKVLLWGLAIVQIVNALQVPEYSYFAFANLLFLFVLYRYAAVKDLKYYFSVVFGKSYDDASTAITKENILKLLAKSLPASLINFTVFPGLGYLLVLPFRTQIDDQVITFFNSHDVRNSIALINSVEDKAITIRYRITWVIILLAIAYYLHDDFASYETFFILLNPVRGISEYLPDASLMSITLY